MAALPPTTCHARAGLSALLALPQETRTTGRLRPPSRLPSRILDNPSTPYQFSAHPRPHNENLSRFLAAGLRDGPVESAMRDSAPAKSSHRGGLFLDSSSVRPRMPSQDRKSTR